MKNWDLFIVPSLPLVGCIAMALMFFHFAPEFERQCAAWNDLIDGKVTVHDTDGLAYAIKPSHRDEFDRWCLTQDGCGVWTGRDFSRDRIK